MLCPNCKIPLARDGRELKCVRCVFNTIPNSKKMKELYAWVYVDNLDNEGIIGVRRGDTMIAAVNSNLETVMKLRPEMKDIADTMKIKLRLIRFKRDIDVEEI